MIYSVHGKLIHMEANLAVVECGGVGYKCLTTANTLSTLPPLGGEVRLLTWLQVREEGVELFGFAEERELTSFKMLSRFPAWGLRRPCPFSPICRQRSLPCVLRQGTPSYSPAPRELARRPPRELFWNCGTRSPKISCFPKAEKCRLKSVPGQCGGGHQRPCGAGLLPV